MPRSRSPKGESCEEELGRLKGEAEALEQVATQQECVELLDMIEKAQQEAPG